MFLQTLIKHNSLYFILIISNVYLFSLATDNSIHQTIPTATFNISYEPPNHNFQHAIRIAHNTSSTYNSSSCYDNYSKRYYAAMTPTDFEYAFQGMTTENILNNYPLYAFPNFLAFARTLSSYEAHILSLNDKIQKNKQFRKQTACMPYFEYKFGLRYEISGFHNFIKNEALKIINARRENVSQKNPNFRNLDTLLAKYSQKNIPHKLSAERINAINQTKQNNEKSFDYSSQINHLTIDALNTQTFKNTYGTQLDCQLHKELCEIRNTIYHLEHTHINDRHVNILAPVVYDYTTQAKSESCLLRAFEISDFCHTVTQILSKGMHILYDTSSAISKGAWKGINEFTSIEHWKNMATGALHLALLYAYEVGQEESLHYAILLNATSNNFDALHNAATKYCMHTQNQKDAFNAYVQETHKKIKLMSWQELLEQGTQIGTTIILDTLALNALNNFNGKTADLFMKQVNNALKNELFFTEQHVVEVAGFGKYIIEEGSSASSKAIDLIENDLALFAKNSNPVSQQIKQKAPSFISEKDIVQNIQNMGDNILDIMEKEGGHTLEKHVSKTYNQLLLRSIKLKDKTITAFLNKKAAIKAVKENLKNNTKKIVEWLLTNPSCSINQSFDFIHNHPIGKGIIKGKKNGLRMLNQSRIILVPCSTNEFGFEIITSFPIQKL